MAERYTKLSSLAENQYTKGAPILIAAGALLKDNQTGKALAQLKFKNISSKTIKAIKITVSAFDVAGKELEGVEEYQYLDLSATRSAEFGQKQAIPLPNAVTRSFGVKCTDVFFSDGSVWNAASDASWTPLPAQETVAARLDSLAAQYQRDTSSKSKFIPLAHEDLWLCACGSINREEDSGCRICYQDKEKLLAALDLERLKQRNDAYEKDKAEKAAKQAAEAEKQAAAEKAQRAKTKKFAIIAAVAVSVCLLITNVIIPNSKYNDAFALRKAGQYGEAIAAFEALDGYKDSAVQIEYCKISIKDNQYAAAVALMDAGDYEEAISAFEALDGYKDSAAQIENCKISIKDNQ